MTINSKAKGKKGELEISHILKEYGYEARRSQQFAGMNGDADVVGVDGLHIEVKRVEKLNLENAMQQSIRDAREGEIPSVFHRKNRGEWLVTVRMTDFMDIWKGEKNGLVR